MTAAEKKKIVKYWNFTLKKPAYYTCPSAKYPSLKFITGEHPKGFCLPCCKKLVSSSRKDDICSTCLIPPHIYTKVGNIVPATHILAYGKDIETGRFGALPADIKKLLSRSNVKGIEDADSHDDHDDHNDHNDKSTTLYLIGSEHIQKSNDIAIIQVFAALYDNIRQKTTRDVKSGSADRADTPTKIHALTSMIISNFNNHTDYFSHFLNGTLIHYFNDINDLSHTMEERFIRNHSILTKKTFNRWYELLCECFYVFLDCGVFTFEDRGGSNSISLHTQANFFDSIVYDGGRPAYFGIILRCGFKPSSISASSASSTPDNLSNISSTDDAYSRIYAIGTQHDYVLVNAPIFERLAAVIRFSHSKNKSLTLNYPKIVDFCKSSKYKLDRKLINRSNLCYAVILTVKTGVGASVGVSVSVGAGAAATSIYIAIEYTSIVADDIRPVFDGMDG